MNKSISKISICLVLVMLFTIMFSGCGIFGNGSSNVQDDKIYTIMYSDGVKTHTIEVKNGDVYSIDTPLPTKTGYDFAGLYDSETGGAQYVSSSGMSVAPFSDRKNIVLYPQFKAKTYNLILNYGEANVTGVTSVSVDYDSIIPVLPGSLVIADKPYMNFLGWFTSTNCRGTQVCNGGGISTLKMDSDFAKLFDSEQNIKLYAGFSAQMYTVTFMSYDGLQILKTAQIAHGSNISMIANGITENGATVTEWSTAANSHNSIFNGEVMRDMTLYAMNYKFSVTLDRNGCALDNGFNSEKAQSEQRNKTHQDYELVGLNVSGCAINSNGDYKQISGNTINLSLVMLQNPSSLPKNAVLGYTLGLPWDWQQNKLSKDSFSGEVCGTNISGKEIGYGAYYIKVTYKDNTYTETNAVNFLDNKNKGSVCSLNTEFDMNKLISQIEIVVVYEIYYYVYSGGWWGDYSNWRCSTTLQFV